MNTTGDLADWIASSHEAAFSERALTFARHAVLDWLGVALAGSGEAVSEILLKDAMINGEQGLARIVGRGQRVSTSCAVLVNGTASHALDYDDINKRMRGHPTVTVLPAILAVADQNNSPGLDLLTALVVGTETACIVGAMLGSSHYDQGFHTTATAGTIGAAAGVAYLYRLDAEQVATAIGLAATQAAGLRGMFGTMAKPLHAGKAAMNGLLAARWAAAGLDAHPSVLEAEQGLGHTMAGTPANLRVRTDSSEAFAIEENIYKYHAACYYTHSAIDIVKSMIEDGGLRTQDVSGIQVYLMPNLLDVCDIKTPATGLEVKFSIRHLLAMALAGMDTGDIAVYSDEVARDPQLCDLRSLVSVAPETFASRTEARVSVDLRDGSRREKTLDAGIPLADPALQFERLSAKYMTLAAPVIGEARAESARELVSRLHQAGTCELLDMVCTR